MKVLYNDIELLKGFQNGEETAVKTLYNEYYRPICYFAFKLTHHWQEAEDIAVETFIKLLKKKEDFDNLYEIKSFLFTASRNACFDFLRKEKRHDRANQEIAYLLIPDDSFAEHELITAKVLQAIYSEIENLPEQCQYIFKALFLDGKTTAMIADELGLQTQTVLNQKARAIQKLRFSIYSQGILPETFVLLCLLLIGMQ